MLPGMVNNNQQQQQWTNSSSVPTPQHQSIAINRNRTVSENNTSNTNHILNVTGGLVANQESRIKDVWSYNLWVEMKAIREILHLYPYIAMDTEFPGVVSKPIGVFTSQSEYLYTTLKLNVDFLQIIQLGITFFDENGNMPEGEYTTWQFNFKFCMETEMYAQDSIDLLTNSQIQFQKHEEDGIDPYEFGALLVPSGLVLNEEVKWLTFHSTYDFGYLLKLLTRADLPCTEGEFYELVSLYFPYIYDVKHLMKTCRSLRGGLQELADQLEVKRIGSQHQAGSDSLLTGLAFFKIRDMFFEGIIDNKYCNHMFGLGNSAKYGAVAASEQNEPQ